MSTAAFDSNILEIPHNSEEDASVLSLVRTAEASRLRRRGPFGLDHNRSVSQRGARAPLQPLLLVPSRSTASESFELLPTVYPTPVPMTPPRQRQSFVSIEDLYKGEDGENDSSSGHHIYCGVMEEMDDETFKVSPLPTCPSNSTSGERSRKSKFTGCGAVIHTSAVPKPKHGTWYAKGSATSAVVRLNAIYFDDGGGKSTHMHCGCRYYGVGCSICGNVLGNVWIPCRVVSPNRPLGSIPSPEDKPEVPRYTFYSTSVSSSTYVFPDSPSLHIFPHTVSSFVPVPPTIPTSPGSTDGGDENMNASLDEDDEGYQEPGVEYDPDGEYILASEPSQHQERERINQALLWSSR